MELTARDTQQLNEWANFFAFKKTWIFNKFINSDARFNCLLYGNQAGKTSGVAYSYVLRILGLHPVAEKNLDYYICKDGHGNSILSYSKRPKDPQTGMAQEEYLICKECGEPVEMYYAPQRIFRFGSESLPMSTGGDEEVKNTQYPELMKWLPHPLIKKHLTVRNTVITIFDVNGGPDIFVEFVGYNQSVQSTGGHQRAGIWLDEESPPDFLEEQIPRLYASNGGIDFSMTAANRTTYMFDDYYEKAKIYFRTKRVVEYANATLNWDVKTIETSESTSDIAVFQAATDDNPTLDPQAIEEMIAHIDDEDVIAIRRYGLFKQIKGRVFKSFIPVHIISTEKWFPDGMPTEFTDDFGHREAPWIYARGIDYHPHVEWHFGAIALSPQDEAFVFAELKMSPERFTTEDIGTEISYLSGDIRFMIDRIDPLAGMKQGNTRKSTIDDLNKLFRELKKHGGTGAYWKPWNTKSTRGRDEIRLRLNNAVKCGEPFNNEVTMDGQTKYLPTIWFLDSCPGIIDYMRKWRLGEHKERDAIATKDQNEKPQQKWSHYPMVLEGIFKEASFRPRGVPIIRTGRINNRFRSLHA